MQASTQQVFRDLLSKMGDQGRKQLTILLLGVLPSGKTPQYFTLHKEAGLVREQDDEQAFGMYMDVMTL